MKEKILIKNVEENFIIGQKVIKKDKVELILISALMDRGYSGESIFGVLKRLDKLTK